jgi:hypothetical protein
MDDGMNMVQIVFAVFVQPPLKLTMDSFLYLLSILPVWCNLQFWNAPSALTIKKRKTLTATTRRRTTKAQWNMYFDDCERHSDLEEWEAWIPALGSSVSSSGARKAWMASRSEEKKQAIENLLGYNPTSAAALSKETIETETLQWALDCNIIWAGDDTEREDGSTAEAPISETTITSMYASISDLIIASECNHSVDCLAVVWNLIAKTLDFQEFNSVYMVVFPNATAMWEYDVMVTALQALTISVPLLPPNMQLHLDLFHPDYKHSPRMWSPEMHSPFPTLALSITREPTSTLPTRAAPSSSKGGSKEEQSSGDELEATRSRLEALFERIDADGRVNARPVEENIDAAQVREECKKWAQGNGILKEDASSSIEWLVETHTEPFHLYTRLWSAIQGLQAKASKLSSTMLIAPNLDAHTTKRIAITVNAALQRLQSPVRVVNIFHPNVPTSNSRQAPHAMIQLMHETTPPRCPSQ